MEPQLRDPLLGRITIGFILNLICCFIVIINNHVKDAQDVVGLI